jgi:hypothetical protein
MWAIEHIRRRMQEGEYDDEPVPQLIEGNADD